MKRQNDYVEEVTIQQVENGYLVYIGSGCNVAPQQRSVFQSFTELVNHLNNHFTYRDENIHNDYINQTSITLKTK